MIKASVTIDDAVDLLNEALVADPVAMTNLIVHCKTKCNDTLAEHPTIQIGYNGKYILGMLGFLNGLFGVDVDGYGPIVAVFDDNTRELVEFRRGGAKNSINS